ncbi:MAG: hypothetical protein B7Z83_04710 [Thiomonas sp. 20-64-5]|nr:MAG: hypothetical protein B7Z83_04710 [Thiomonas sp. 20-64-5]
MLLAHALLLAWLVFKPAAPASKPEQRLEWVTLEPAKPRPRAPSPIPAPKVAHPAPTKPEIAKPAPRIAAPKAAPAKPQPPMPHAATTLAQAPQAAQPAAPTPTQAPTPSQTPPPAPAAPGTETEPGQSPSVTSSAPPTATPTMETAASYKAEYLDNPPPPYPRLSRQLGEEGTALLKVQVGPDGRALQVKLMSSTGYPRLDDAAVATVAQWRFVAATRNGQAVTSWVLVPIKFRILN